MHGIDFHNIVISLILFTNMSRFFGRISYSLFWAIDRLNEQEYKTPKTLRTEQMQKIVWTWKNSGKIDSISLNHTLSKYIYYCRISTSWKMTNLKKISQNFILLICNSMLLINSNGRYTFKRREKNATTTTTLSLLSIEWMGWYFFLFRKM